MFLIIDSDKDHADGHKHEANKKLVEKFNKRNRCKGWVLKKSEIENYYHPKAIERLYVEGDDVLDSVYDLDLANYFFNSEKLFANDVSAKNFLKKLREKVSKNVKTSSNVEIIDEMTKEEWQDVSGGELEEIFKTMFSSSS